MINWIANKFAARIFNAATLANPPEWLREWFNGGQKDSITGQNVTPDSALRVAAVYACLRVLAESIASLPIHVYRRLPNGGKEIAVQHPLNALLHSTPNAEMTSFDLFELIMAHLGLRGNHYSQKVMNGRGQILELLPLHPDNMQIKRNAAGELEYKYFDPEKNTQRQFLSGEIWRIQGMGSNGIVGMSPIAVARETIGLSMAINEHGAKTFKNGAQMSGVLESPGNLTNEQQENLRTAWDSKYSGTENAGKTAVLTGGMKFNKISLSNEDAQFLESRKFQVTEIARIFRVPPHMIGDLEKATFSNIEQQGIDFIIHTLRPWVVRIEKSIQRDLFLPSERGSLFAEFNMEGFLRGDSAARSAFYKEAIINGWMNRNEARTKENLNPVEGLDEFLVPLNMANASGEPLADTPANNRLRRMVQGTALRVVNREINTIAKAIEKNQFTDQWARQFYSEHESFIMEALAVPRETARAWTGVHLTEILGEGNADTILKEWARLAPQQLADLALHTETRP